MFCIHIYEVDYLYYQKLVKVTRDIKTDKASLNPDSSVPGPILDTTLPRSLPPSLTQSPLPARHSSPQVVITTPSPSSSSIAYWSCRSVGRSSLLVGRSSLLVGWSSLAWPHNSKSQGADFRLKMNIGLCLNLLVNVGLCGDLIVDIRHNLRSSRGSRSQGD